MGNYFGKNVDDRNVISLFLQKAERNVTIKGYIILKTMERTVENKCVRSQRKELNVGDNLRQPWTE